MVAGPAMKRLKKVECSPREHKPHLCVLKHPGKVEGGKAPIRPSQKLPGSGVSGNPNFWKIRKITQAVRTANQPMS